ncbi:heavy metal translocating P-type ATPase [Mariprofundus ferrooxydans]|nr:heavy metal translocating P-type ATPase [Mariprofundus ferrooxydans]
MNERSSLRIQGMDCPDCAARIEKAVVRLPGVANVRVNFIGETLSAEVNSEESMQRMRKAICSLGYSVEEDGEKRVTSVLQVKGMDCSEEKVLVEKVLTGIPGLERFDVNLMSQRLRVIHDPNILPLSGIIRVLENAGLSAAPFGAAQPTEGRWSRYGREISTGTAGILTGVGLLLHFMDAGNVWEITAYSLAIASGGWFIARKGLAAARHRSLDMNFLMMVAVIGAMGIGAWDEGAMVVFLFALAQMLEGRAMDRARSAVRTLMDLAPPTARLIREGKELSVSVDEIKEGDVFRLRPGEKVPLDGEIIDGSSAVNQAPITGESVPVDKESGDIVYAGSINSQGSLDVRVTHKASDTTLAHIIHLIEEAQAARAPSQSFIDRFARIYTPAVLVLAVLIAVLPALLMGQSFGEWFYRALVLLVIACPCALVISTPVAIVSGLARGARDGILIKGGAHLENAGHIKALALDKTGTLTEGLPRVQDIEPLNETPKDELIRIAASLEARSEHPLAQAIRDYASACGIESEQVSEFKALTGLGVQGRVQGQDFLLGNHRLFEERGLCTPEVEAVLKRHEAAGKTVMILGNSKHVMGLIAVADNLRPEARATIEALRSLGIRQITMLTGDNRRTAQTIARDLGLDDIQAELMPVDKVAAVKKLVEQHHKVGMVGDGVNDAPAMAAATTGIAMGAAGSDAALETADVILMSDDLTKLPLAIRLSRATLAIIRQNIFLSLLIKAVFLALALTGHATLWMAVFADMGASLIVIANGLRLLRIKHAAVDIR